MSRNPLTPKLVCQKTYTLTKKLCNPAFVHSLLLSFIHSFIRDSKMSYVCLSCTLTQILESLKGDVGIFRDFFKNPKGRLWRERTKQPLFITKHCPLVCSTQTVWDLHSITSAFNKQTQKKNKQQQQRLEMHFAFSFNGYSSHPRSPVAMFGGCLNNFESFIRFRLVARVCLVFSPNCCWLFWNCTYLAVKCITAAKQGIRWCHVIWTSFVSFWHKSR